MLEADVHSGVSVITIEENRTTPCGELRVARNGQKQEDASLGCTLGA
jgi:hypothetical protein